MPEQSPAGTPGDDAATAPRRLPETPHELPYNRAHVDDLLTRVRDGAAVDLHQELLAAVDWSAFAADDGEPLGPLEREQLRAYYHQKFADVGPLYLAELLSTEFMTEQRARGDLPFSERLLALGRNEPELWAEIGRVFRRKEMVTAMLAAAHRTMDTDEDGARPDGPRETKGTDKA